MRRTVAYVFISLLLITLHFLLAEFLAVGDIVPDALLVWIVYLAIREGQVTGSLVGFAIGLAIDLMSGSDAVLGLSALAKTIGGFSAGYFYNENKTLQTLGGYQFIIAIATASLLHNVVYFLIILQGKEVPWWHAVLLYGVPTTLYTAVAGLVPMFAFARKYLT
jgi:rod shape-determining protein MreD